MATIERSIKRMTDDELTRLAENHMNNYEVSPDSRTREIEIHLAYGLLSRHVAFGEFVPEAEPSRLRLLSLLAVPRFEEDRAFLEPYIG